MIQGMSDFVAKLSDEDLKQMIEDRIRLYRTSLEDDIGDCLLSRKTLEFRAITRAKARDEIYPPRYFMWEMGNACLMRFYEQTVKGATQA